MHKLIIAEGKGNKGLYGGNTLSSKFRAFFWLIFYVLQERENVVGTTQMCGISICPAVPFYVLFLQFPFDLRDSSKGSLLGSFS